MKHKTMYIVAVAASAVLLLIVMRIVTNRQQAFEPFIISHPPVQGTKYGQPTIISNPPVQGTRNYPQPWILDMNSQEGVKQTIYHSQVYGSAYGLADATIQAYKNAQRIHPNRDVKVHTIETRMNVSAFVTLNEYGGKYLVFFAGYISSSSEPLAAQFGKLRSFIKLGANITPLSHSL